MREVAVARFADDWRTLAGLCGGTATDGDGIVTVISGIKSAVFNRILALSAPGDAATALATSMASIEGLDLPYVLEVFPGAEAVGRAAMAAGLSKSGEQPFMIHPDSSQVRMRAPEGIDIRPVQTAAELQDWCRVAAEGFGMPAEHVIALAPAGTWLGSAAVRAFTAYESGTPIATSLAAFNGEACGIYTVATLEAARRRGIGESVTAAAVIEGTAHGCEIAYLQASDKGYPVYKKMGFEEVFRSGFYVQSPTS